MHLRRSYTHADALEQARARIALLMDEGVDQRFASANDAEISMLRKCLLKLSARLRDIFQQRYFDNTRICDIAARQATSVTAISNALFHGRKQLRDCMKGSQ